MKKLIQVLLVIAVAFVLMGNKGCDRQDVITSLKVTQSTLNILYNGTVKPLIEEYCKDLVEGDENFDVCAEFPTIDATTAEFLGTTMPSLIRIAELVIPEGTEPSGDDVAKAFTDLYFELPVEQQAAIRAKIINSNP